LVGQSASTTAAERVVDLVEQMVVQRAVLKVVQMADEKVEKTVER